VHAPGDVVHFEREMRLRPPPVDFVLRADVDLHGAELEPEAATHGEDGGLGISRSPSSPQKNRRHPPRRRAAR
jgi:hypothetical protein